jgi:hypothetical protein
MFVAKGKYPSAAVKSQAVAVKNQATAVKNQAVAMLNSVEVEKRTPATAAGGDKR